MGDTHRSLKQCVARVFALLTALTCAVGPALAALPITFEQNRGQAAPEVAFLSRAAGYHVFLTRSEAVITPAGGPVVRIGLAHSRSSAPVGAHRLLAQSNYLIGNDPARWTTHVANYDAVTYPHVYAGIDMAWHANNHQIEHDFRLAPSADPRQIRLTISGAPLQLTPEGELLAGSIRLHKPRAYQGSRDVECRYELRGQSVRFVLGLYDHRRPLTIDPVLVFSTFLGGTDDTATTYPGATTPTATTLDAAGNLYVAGATASLDFPVTGSAFQTKASGGVCGQTIVGVPVGVAMTSPCDDIFVAKFSGDGKTLLYATYLGGPGDDTATAIAVGGPAGALYLAGRITNTPGNGAAIFPKLTPLSGQTIASNTSFVAELSADGSSLLYATALPADTAGLAVDAAGAVYLTGNTTGTLPLVSAFQSSLADGDVFKSADAGNHWQALHTSLPQDYVADAAADPANSQVLYLSRAAGLYKTSDGGVTWNSIGSGIAPGFSGLSLVIDPHSPQTLYVGGSILPGAICPCLYKSSDAGATWSLSGSGLPSFVSRVAVAAANSSILYASTSAGIFKSSDAGASWSITGLSTTASQLVVDPTNADTVYAVTTSGVMKTTDGGSTWANQGVVFNAIAIDPTNPQTLYAAARGIFGTSDGGAHWAPLFSLPQSDQAISIAVDPGLHSRIWAIASSGMYVSVDSGSTWIRTQLPHMPQTLVFDAADVACVFRGFVGPAPGKGTLGDAFVMKLDASGSTILYSTYLGGMGRDVPGGIAVDGAGRAYIAGETDSPDFPLSSPLQTQFGGDSDAFVSVLDPTGSHLVWSTFVGGSSAEGAAAVAIDPVGDVHLAGIVSPFNPFLASSNYLAPGDSTADAFVAKLKGDGSALVYSTSLGGSAFDGARGVAADSAGNTYIAGPTASRDLPVLNAFQSALSGAVDALVAEFDGQSGAVRYATYLGGSQNDFANAIAADFTGNAYVVGSTASPDFPLQNPWQSSKSQGVLGFVTKLSPQGSNLRLEGVTNAASYTTTVAPGELVSIFGTALAAGVAASVQTPLSTQLSDAKVSVNGVAAPLIYVSPQQVNAQIPFETQVGPAQLQVTSSAGTASMAIPVASVAPAIFSLNMQGTGPGAILHGLTNQVVTDSNPAAAGEIISIYCTGLGVLNPAAQTGAAPPSPPPQTVMPVQVMIGGAAAAVSYQGVAPGYAGLYQVNAQIPAGAASGTLSVQIFQNGAASNIVTIAVR